MDEIHISKKGINHSGSKENIANYLGFPIEKIEKALDSTHLVLNGWSIQSKEIK